MPHVYKAGSTHQGPLDLLDLLDLGADAMAGGEPDRSRQPGVGPGPAGVRARIAGVTRAATVVASASR